MSLPQEPVVKKFFSNKIESARDDWYGYLIQIARIFYSLDGATYDRDELLNKFRALGGRNANADRDVANFRDEFGAYGTYLGIYHLEQVGGEWKIVVSGAAKQFLCTENPNAAAFCRAQLALFQYPNGAGAVVNAHGTVNVQANSLTDTIREISTGIKLNPFRLLCRIVVSQVELRHRTYGAISIPYHVLFCMVNDDRINRGYNPSLEIIDQVFSEYSANDAQIGMNLDGLTNYKRNFHIFEKTGLFVRDSRFGLMVSQTDAAAAYNCIKVISEMDGHFDAFDSFYDHPDETGIRNIVAGVQWAQYYDAANLPRDTLADLGVEFDVSPIQARAFQGEQISGDIDPTEQKQRFRLWLQQQVKADGQPYSNNTINTYISQIERGYAAFDKYHYYTSPFQIQKTVELEEYTSYLFNAPGFDAFNEQSGNRSCINGFQKYKEYLQSLQTEVRPLCFNTSLRSDKSRNRILFGAPGTGKSYTLNEERKSLLGEGNESDYERVTFHPDYSYASFVGTYKPVPKGEAITYEYVPGPFMRVYVNALKSGRSGDVKPFLLLIEEINRANVAAVFGDIFQLLDRDENGVSEYPIQASEDMKAHLAKKLGGVPEDYSKILIPNNMFIWATMNSADQGVFPMDTAFKRRWDFTYIGINDSEQGLLGKTVVLGEGNEARRVEWNELRRAINDRLSGLKINEDKLLGPYFLSRKVIPVTGEINRDVFITAFKNKVLMYLFDDAAKQKRPSLFAEGIDTTKYSSICEAFDRLGVFVFCTEISSRFRDAAPISPEGETL